MKFRFALAGAITALLIASPAAFSADDFATPQEAEAMVQKAIDHIHAVGKEQAFADITGKKPGWIDRDLYPVVFDREGNNLAHGQNPKMVGKNFLGVTDAGGTAFISERMELAKTHTSYWHDYKYKDPVTKAILPKTSYCQTSDDLIVCAGVYKR
ncbi:cache domain-containing protein [Thiorhodococcus drewsii]|uniref:cache domain-containing protein n=1 Tax=Thiorhodococcus drewsii TaxID=210408 RepID=UPI00068262B9|nr:cache domain-containing protein [Thiorhodococcus drewsii]